MLRRDFSELRLYLWIGIPIPLKGNRLSTALGSTRLYSCEASLSELPLVGRGILTATVLLRLNF